MMGYAHAPADLALGATLDALFTGDIARRGSDGLYEVIGRRSRFVKMYGLRIDLQQVETTLREQDVRALCTDNGDHLAVVAVSDRPRRELQRLAASAAGIPGGAVDAVCVRELPTLAIGQARLPGGARAGRRRRDGTPRACRSCSPRS